MARAGMLHRGGKNGADGCDDVQRSLELLDQVLSEYDEGEPRSLEARAPAAATPATPATPATDDDSPLAGHTSEDDGYMSMNGRRAKFALGFRPTEEREELSPPDPPSPHSPPPPEEAQRIISTLLPKVSPANSAKRTTSIEQREAEEKLDSIISINGITTATQTTFPKTKHQRPYGWEKDNDTTNGFHLQQPPVQSYRFASLQHGARPPPPDGLPSWLPPRHHAPPTNQKISPSLENAPVFPFMGFSSEFNDKPYNEHPVTIYPGPNIQYNKQLHSDTYNIPKLSPSNTRSSEKKKRDSRSDGDMLSPKTKIPPRTLAGSMERHREVCRGSSEDMTEEEKRRGLNRSNDDEHFSDDSLEEAFPPPPPAVTTPSKRNSIAWEVSLDGDDPLLTPGSTKVIGRRRRKSGDHSHSSTSSIPQRVDDDWGEEYWPPPPPLTLCEPLVSPTSDGEHDNRRQDLASGTYVIRKGKNRKQLPSFNKNASKPINTSNLIHSHSLNRSLDIDKSIDGSSISISGSGSVGSYNSRPSSDLSLPQSRYSVDLNSRLSRELNTPNSRYSIDLCTPNSRLSKEMTSPKSRLSLDLNNGPDRYITQEYFGHSPKSRKIPSDKSTHSSKNNVVQSKLSPQNRFTDFKKYSSTFDNIQSLIKEGKIEETSQSECNETVNELSTIPPNMVRVVSLPSLGAEGESNTTSRQALITTVEEEEDQESAEPGSSGETSPLRKIENNISAILSQGRDQNHFTPYIPKDWNIHKDEYCDDVSKDILDNNFRYSSRERQKRHDIQKSSSHNEIQNRSIDRRDRSSGRRSNSMHKSTSAKDVPVSLMRQPSSSDSAVSSGGDFPLNVQIVEHSYRHHQLPASPNLGHDMGPLPQTPESPKFPPLPPSPVQEVDEYTEIMQPLDKRHPKKADTLPTPTMEIRRRPSEPPAVPPHRDTTNSLKTRSMETSYNKNRRNSNFKSGSTDRRTLPTVILDIGASGARRRTLQRQSRDAVSGRGPLQTSASLPETPVFARGCDVPRTPPRNSTGPPRNNTMNSIQSIGSSATLGGYGRGSVMGAGVCTGADLLRLGGPPRGWYPRQRHRPASTEHLDRLTASKSATEHPPAWEAPGARKPLTLPPNITPKFFQKSPREALRRVTSLLIRKGNSGKEKENARNKEATSPAARSANGEEHPGQKQRKGFFRSLWKKSRHYSLEHP
ncbi:uncharacterized protein LOC128669079 isoform X2 [Plodia interpunctella]|uniref:uncharacterized protein LOC128669079 isoform X2 n=1 Tax=Plodia interpunctella TaxID=58824 RepID=UPI002367E226|nr:uncharacterized protein LOC128669079 isoform X2 [Plodia interpunctella]